jgi:hypothetical protein
VSGPVPVVSRSSTTNVTWASEVAGSSKVVGIPEAVSTP